MTEINGGTVDGAGYIERECEEVKSEADCESR